MTAPAHDLRHAVRMLAKQPGVTIVIVLTLALSVGANASVFALVDAILVRPLPVAAPDRIVVFDKALSVPDLRDVVERQQVFSGVAAGTSAPIVLNDGAATDRVAAQAVTGNYFDVLGVRAALGRTFAAGEDGAPGEHPVAVLSDDAWRKRFGADPGVVGSTVLVNGHPFAVVGVAPRGFRGTDVVGATELWVPLAMGEQIMPGYEFASERRERAFGAFARLATGVSVEQARANLDAVARSLADEHPDEDRGIQFPIAPLAEARSPVRESLGPVLGLLMFGAALTLLIACANVANLLIVRAVGRRREMAIRRALGASYARIVRQLVVEGFVLVALSTAVGAVTVIWMADALVALLVPAGTGAPAAGVDARVALFVAAVMAVVVMVFGVAPAAEVERREITPDLVAESAAATPGRWRLHATLAALQVALSVLLFVGAGLFGRSLVALLDVDPGIAPENVLTFRVSPPLSGYAGERNDAVVRQIRERVGALPGVRGATTAQLVQLGFGDIARPIVQAGEASGPDAERDVGYNVVGSSYFRTLGTPLLAGREFEDRDAPDMPPVAVVNASLASLLWPGESAVGKRVQLPLGKGESPEVEVVGVVADGKYQSLAEAPKPFFFLPLSQNRRASVTFLLRTEGDPAALAEAVRREMRAIDPNLPAFAMQPLDVYLSTQIQGPRTVAMLLGLFATFAALLAAVGLYSVLSYAVSRRTREIGVRMALGAGRANVVALVASRGMWAAAVGIATGLAASYGLVRLASSLLFGVQVTDPITYVAAAGLMAVVALAACIVPALRAASVDPVTALRHD